MTQPGRLRLYNNLSYHQKSSYLLPITAARLQRRGWKSCARKKAMAQILGNEGKWRWKHVFDPLHPARQQGPLLREVKELTTPQTINRGDWCPGNPSVEKQVGLPELSKSSVSQHRGSERVRENERPSSPDKKTAGDRLLQTRNKRPNQNPVSPPKNRLSNKHTEDQYRVPHSTSLCTNHGWTSWHCWSPAPFPSPPPRGMSQTTVMKRNREAS